MKTEGASELYVPISQVKGRSKILSKTGERV